MHSVLIIDENREEVITLKEFLKKEGYKVFVSYNVKEGFYKAKEKKPDLVIVGIDFSNMNGFDLIREIKSDAALMSIYLIVLSSEYDDFNKVLALELGSDDCLTKPVYNSELLARMKSMLKYPRRIIS